MNAIAPDLVRSPGDRVRCPRAHCTLSAWACAARFQARNRDSYRGVQTALHGGCHGEHPCPIGPMLAARLATRAPEPVERGKLAFEGAVYSTRLRRREGDGQSSLHAPRTVGRRHAAPGRAAQPVDCAICERCHERPAARVYSRTVPGRETWCAHCRDAIGESEYRKSQRRARAAARPALPLCTHCGKRPQVQRARHAVPGQETWCFHCRKWDAHAKDPRTAARRRERLAAERAQRRAA